MHPVPESEALAPVRPRAPWRDFAGNVIHAGDTICHPDGESGVVRYVPTGPDGRPTREDANRWFVDYGRKPWTRLVLQVGDKCRAVVVHPEA